MRFLVGLMGACFLFTACSQADSATPKPDLASEEQAIRAADAQWMEAVKAKDPAAEAALFASDGLAYREHVDPMNPDAFQAYSAKEYADNPEIEVTWTTDNIQMAESGDLAVQTGEFHVMHLGPKGDGEDKGRFVTVWKKTNGEWKVAHDIGSTTMPEPAP